MKKGKGSLALICAFILVCFIGSVFYLLADFGKAITKQGGLGWLVISIVLLIALLCKARKVFLLCTVLVALIQIPILVCCLTMGWAGCYLFQVYVPVTGWWTAFHVFVLLFSAFICWDNTKTRIQGRWSRTC